METQQAPSPTFPEPTSEERLLAGFAHFFGLWVALIIWLVQKDRSAYIRFQAVQAMAYAGITIAVNLLVFGCFFASFVGLGLLTTLGFFIAAQQDAAAGPLLLVPLLFPFSLGSIVVVVAAAESLPRWIAAIQTLRGQDFRYPWLGRQVERFLKGG